MTDDIVSELSELQRHASALQGLIVAAQANAPRSAEGSDPTGTVWATLGADGLPAFQQDVRGLANGVAGNLRPEA